MHEFGGVLQQIVVRAVIPAIGLLLAIVIAARNTALAHEIGTHAIVFDTRANAFVVAKGDGHRIRVFDFGLEEGRGLAFRRVGNEDHLYVADAWDALFDCQLSPSKPTRCVDDPQKEHQQRRLPPTEICPFGECVVVEHGGVALSGDALYVSDAHQRRISRRDLVTRDAKSWSEGVLGQIHDVAVIEPGVIVVAESPFDVGTHAKSGETVENTEAAAHEPSLRRSSKAGVYVLTDKSSRPHPLEAEFNHPVGVAFARGVLDLRDRLYVADINGRFESWRFFERDAEQNWREKGVLWTQTIPDPEKWPHLQSMVATVGNVQYATGQGVTTTRREGALFAAGADGLYLFHSDGTLLAKYVLGAPVHGLAWGRRNGNEQELFMTIGRRLCVLMTRAQP